ncbi:MAG: hypothetical protein JSV06_11475 [Myxococcales bacterium]|nr:MAG: hypothetical protein JSV06_11475 [Myxococcales bacterium]
MADPLQPKNPAEQLGMFRVLWAALFASTIIYIVVLELTTVESGADWQSLAPMFALGGLGAAGASVLAPRFVRKRPPAEPTSTQAAAPYLVALILALALAETVCILGLVLGFLGAPPSVVMPFFVVTWILMIVRFPTKEKLDAF